MPTNRYATEIDQGADAYHAGDARRHNPHVWHTCEWYAWDAGWAEAEAADKAEG